MARNSPTFVNEVPGDFITSALWNAQVGATMQWLFGTGAGGGVPRFSGYSSTAQSVPSGQSFFRVSLDTEEYDSEGGHSTTTNPSRYTVQVPGMYRIVAHGSYNASSSGVRALAIGVNGTAKMTIQQAPQGAAQWAGVTTCDTYLNATDYVECLTWQSSGSALTTSNSGGLTPSLALWWIGNN